MASQPTASGFLHRGRAHAGLGRRAPALLIAALALALRLYGLGRQPFWLDEIATLRRATGSVHDLVLDALHNHHTPSYFLLLWVVARLGTEEWLLRLPSAIFGAAAAGLAAGIGRDVAGPRSGIVAGLLLALSPLEVELGQEARSYTLVCVLILVALWGALRLAGDPARAALPGWRREASGGAWLAYVLGTGAALNALGVAALWWLAANIGALVIARQAGPARRAFVRQWLLAQGVVLALWAPWWAALLLRGAAGSTASATNWAPPLSTGAVWAAIAPVYLLRISNFITLELGPATVPGLAAAIALLGLFGLWRLRRRPATLAMLAAAAFVPPLCVLLLAPFASLLVPRYLAWSATPFFVLVAAGAVTLPRGRVVAPALLVIASLLTLLRYYGEEMKPRWDLAAQRLAAEARPGDVVLADRGYTYPVFAVYAERADLAGRGIRLSRSVAEAKALAAGHEIWALFGRVGQKAIGPPDDYLRSLAALGRPAAADHIGRFITIYRFAMPAAAARS